MVSGFYCVGLAVPIPDPAQASVRAKATASPGIEENIPLGSQPYRSFFAGLGANDSSCLTITRVSRGMNP
jgi:hypothetical protein